MNNGLLQSDEIEQFDPKPMLRQRLTELTKIIEAINALAPLPEWQALKELVFDGQVERIEKSLLMELKKTELSASEIYRLQGEWKWAKRYSDLYKLAEVYKLEFNNITKKLNENAAI